MITTTIQSRPTARPAPPGRRAAVIALAAAGAFVVLLVLAGVFDPGYSQVSEAISALASTESESAGLMLAGFGVLGVVALASGIALLRSLPGKLARAAGILVGLAGVATVIDGTFRQSCSSLQQECLDREAAGAVSGAHVLHNLIALMLFTLLLVAGFLLAFGLRGSARRPELFRPSLLAAVLGLVFFVWFGSSAFGSYGGLVQRGLVLFAYALPLAVALVTTRRQPE